VGEYTKIETEAYVTAYTVIEERCFIAPMVCMSNDNYLGRTEERFQHMKGPHIKRGARIGSNAVLLPGVIIGEEAVVGAGSVVTQEVPP
jgi:acetyltransferase-like isoleucine patch superfamily enzyme